MSGRHTRESTIRLRSHYAALQRPNRPKSRSGPRSGRDSTLRSNTMAAQNQVGAGANPGGQHTVPPGAKDPPAPGVVPQLGDDDQPGVGDHGQPGRASPNPSPPASPKDMTEYIRRLQLLEERFKQREEAHASRATSRASSRASGSDHGQRESKSRSTRSPRRGSRHASRSPPRRRGYSPTSHRSRSIRRSPQAAPSGRRRRSRSGRRRTSSRSRSSRHRSTASRARSRSPRRSRSRARSRSHRRSRTPRDERREASPRSLRNDPDLRDAAARAAEAQYPAMGVPTGEYLHKSRATLEPYRNLPPDIKTRAGERRSRKELSLPEHMCGLLFMALKVIDPASELYGLIEHSAQVAQDSVTMQWPTVRAWSQACLSHIQDSGAGWRDAALFKDERFRLSWCKGKSQPDTIIPCPAFNTATCPERTQHSGEGRTWMHLCAVCYYGLNDLSNSHTSHGCRKKPGLKLMNDDNRPDGRRRYNNSNNNNNRRDDKADRPKPKN